MSVNKFYTIFWVLYFPICLSFMEIIHRIDKFYDYSDEFLTLGLVLYTFLSYKRWKEKLIKNELHLYIALMIFYLLWAFVIKTNTFNAALLDFQQQVRPYLILYCTWLIAPRFTNKQKKIILWVMLFSYIAHILIIFSGGMSAALSKENGTIVGQMGMMFSMSYYLFHKKSKKNAWIALAIVTLGLLSGKSKFFGEYVVFITILFFLKGKIRRITSLKRIIQISLLVIAVLYFTWTKFNVYYVEGFSEQQTEQMMARPATYRTAIRIIFKDYLPFGSGLGTFATNAAAVHYSPLYFKYRLNKIWGLSPDFNSFLADAFYPTLAEFGLVGVILFIVFWVRRWRNVKEIMDDRYYKVALMCMICLALESVADTSYLSGKGMGYFMQLGMCLGSIKYQPKIEGKELETKQERR